MTRYEKIKKMIDYDICEQFGMEIDVFCCERIGSLNITKRAKVGNEVESKVYNLIRRQVGDLIREEMNEKEYGY